jgi:hypothetical protein
MWQRRNEVWVGKEEEEEGEEEEEEEEVVKGTTETNKHITTPHCHTL